MGKSKSKKSKSKSKQPKEEEIIDVEDEVIDIDVPEIESEDEGDEDSYYSEKENENEAVEVNDRGETLESSADSSDKKGFTSYLQFTQAEMPVLGYTLASLVFFFAAVGKRCGGGGRRRLEDIGDAFEDLFSDVMDASMDLMGFGCLQNSSYAYALCLGILGVLFGLGLVGWMRYSAKRSNVERPFGGDLEEGSQAEEDPTNPLVSRILNAFLFLWAAVGWAIFTFDGMFAQTGNGFFALWAMVLFSIWNLGVTKDTILDASKKSDMWINIMSFGSIITIAGLTAGGGWQYQPNKGVASYALSVAVISLVFGIVVRAFSMFLDDDKQLDPRIRMYTLAALLLLWIVAACLTTFIGPFLTTSNGYFAVWASVIATGMALTGAQSETQEMQ
jgi:hypothetical protein